MRGRAHAEAPGWLCIIAFFGLLAAAKAQTPSPPIASTQYDGTYAFVSSTKVNETQTTGRGQMKPCFEIRRTVGPLTIMNGQARLAGWGRNRASGFDGTVGPQGELRMRLRSTPINGGEDAGVEEMINGRIDATGTIRARQANYWCSHDLIWQKTSK